MYFSDVSKLGHLGAEAHTKALALTRGVEWGSLDQAGRAEMVSEAMSKLGHVGAEAHAKALALTRGVEWGSMDLVGQAEMVSEATCLAAGCAHMCICIDVCVCVHMHMDAYVRL